MSAIFDFQALARSARQDQPDTALLSLVEAYEGYAAACTGIYGLGDAPALAAARLASQAARDLAAFTPLTVEGLRAKLGAAEKLIWKGPGTALLRSVLGDARAWLEANPSPPLPPAKPRRKAR